MQKESDAGWEVNCTYFDKVGGTCKWISLFFQKQIRDNIIQDDLKRCVVLDDASCPVLEQASEFDILERRINDIEEELGI